MMARLYFSRNPNPRLAVATARHLRLPLDFQFAAPFGPGQADFFRTLNPNLSLPILQEAGGTLWEADAIACRLSRMAGSDFWRTDDEEPDMIRWLSWGKLGFVDACDTVHFERGTKQRYGMGPIDAAKVSEGLQKFHDSSRILDAHLADREWLLASGLSYADFRMATFLPFNDVARLPIEDYKAIASWHARLEQLDGWRPPFEGLEAPELPAVRGYEA